MNVFFQVLFVETTSTYMYNLLQNERITLKFVYLVFYIDYTLNMRERGFYL